MQTRPKRLTIAITGASGVAIGVRVLELLRLSEIETHLLISKAGERTIHEEMGCPVKEIKALADHTYPVSDIGAAIASGSFPTDGMLIVPCSIKTMGEVATGVTSSLISRSADVTLKERRPLVMMVRETPLHTGHLRTMTALSEMGAIVMPPVPAFYARPQSMEDMIDQLAARALTLFGIETAGLKVWQGSAEH